MLRADWPAALALLFALGGGPYAISTDGRRPHASVLAAKLTDADGRLHGCPKKRGRGAGLLRVVRPAKRCRRGGRWDDPGLEIPWPQREAHISKHDATLPSLDVLLGELKAAWEG